MSATIMKNTIVTVAYTKATRHAVFIFAKNEKEKKRDVRPYVK